VRLNLSILPPGIIIGKVRQDGGRGCFSQATPARLRDRVFPLIQPLLSPLRPTSLHCWIDTRGGHTREPPLEIAAETVPPKSQIGRLVPEINAPPNTVRPVVRRGPVHAQIVKGQHISRLHGFFAHCAKLRHAVRPTAAPSLVRARLLDLAELVRALDQREASRIAVNAH
jgi:hypothetical protein